MSKFILFSLLESNYSKFKLHTLKLDKKRISKIKNTNNNKINLNF